MIYKYGMQTQRYSPKTAPLFGLIDRKADKTRKFYDILYYDRELSPTECSTYDLELIECSAPESPEYFCY